MRARKLLDEIMHSMQVEVNTKPIRRAAKVGTAKQLALDIPAEDGESAVFMSNPDNSWVLRTQINPKASLILFPKFGGYSIGFEDNFNGLDWPWNDPARTIAKHICTPATMPADPYSTRADQTEPDIEIPCPASYKDTLRAVQLIQAKAKELKIPTESTLDF